MCCSLRRHLHLLLSRRNREIKRIKDSMRAGNSFSFLCHDITELEHSYQTNLPRVTVVMPLKGFGEHNLHNWRSQVSCSLPAFFSLFPLTEREAVQPFSVLLRFSLN